MRSNTPMSIDFDARLRRALGANLDSHERRELPLDGRRHAAVAIVVIDSDATRDDTEPVPEGVIDMAWVPGGGLAPDGRLLSGRMVGVAGGAPVSGVGSPSTEPGMWAT